MVGVAKRSYARNCNRLAYAKGRLRRLGTKNLPVDMVMVRIVQGDGGSNFDDGDERGDANASQKRQRFKRRLSVTE